MPVNPRMVDELRLRFKAGATPSALVRRIAECHVGEPKLDVLVRAYFREAFHVPMLHIGLEQVKVIAAGSSLAILNVTVLPRMIETRTEWDTADSHSWLDAVPYVAATNATFDPRTIPELAVSWDRMDEEAKQFIQRAIENSRVLHEQVQALAALAEQLQQQATAIIPRKAQSA